jgi:hypothetical protein
MELGTPLRTIVVEPVEDPVPLEEEAREETAEEECALPTIPAR